MTKNHPDPYFLVNQQPAQLDIDDISIAYNNHLVLENLSFQVPHGLCLAVVGPNGAGKSTLFKALVGLLPLLSGSIRIHGLPLGNHKECVAYIPQREEVDWRFPVTVRDVVLMGRYIHLGWLNNPRKADHIAVNQALEQLRISDLADYPIHDLSGGQQQRVFLARALAQEPHILLMDEPFTGVDITTQEITMALLQELHDRHVTVLVSTHDLNLASNRFEMVLMLNRRLIAYDIPQRVFTPELVRNAFGTHVLSVDGALVVDECCPPDEHFQEPPHV